MADTTSPQRREQDAGKSDFGCEHYRRRCKIRAPCCQKIFPCRHCHNDTTSELSNPNDRHEIVRHDIKQVICSLCDTEQQVAQVCTNCGVKMGEYFCDICKFYDDDTSKGQFHCEGCGICRVGGRDKFFHCDKCGSCYLVDLRNNHSCIENSMKNNCPVCYEFLFDSIRGAAVMKCGHTMHAHCLDQMTNQNQYRCPICSKTVIESNLWSMLDLEIEAVQMPEEYRYEVSILCNDCNAISKTQFHIVGLKCRHCKSYNTRRINEGES